MRSSLSEIAASLARFVFNCGEGTIRIASAVRLFRWSSNRQIFLTQSDWQHIGGLTTLLREIHKVLINLTGPNEIGGHARRMEQIIGIGGMRLALNINDREELTDNGIDVTCIRLSGGTSNYFACIFD